MSPASSNEHETSSAPRAEPGSGLTLRSVVTALPDLVLGTAFLVTWVRPYAFGEDAVQYFLLTMLLEFIIVHSAAFMGVVALSDGKLGARRVLAVLGLGAFYSLFAAGFALAFRTWWPLYTFWGLTLNRLLGVILGDAPHGRERVYLMVGWGLSAMYYLAGAFATVLLPVPRLGMTEALVDALDLPGSGLWVEQPHRVLAFGFLYFTLTGVGELLGWARSQRFAQNVTPL